MTPEASFKGRVVVATRAALRAQHYVMLMQETGLDWQTARQRLGIAERTAKRYRALWGKQGRIT